MMNVARCTPMNFLPYIDFSTQTPYASADRVVGIAEEGELQAVLVGEPAQLRGLVGRDAHHHRAGRVVLARAVADAARLRRAPGGVRLGVEVEDQGLAGEVVQLHLVAVLVGERERRRLVPGFDHHFSNLDSRRSLSTLPPVCSSGQ